MRLLLDTNIFLEVILDQSKAVEAMTLLLKNDIHDFYASDFTFHSIGLLLFRKNKHEAYRHFLRDMFESARVNMGT